jgi:hypothetical protein
MSAAKSGSEGETLSGSTLPVWIQYVQAFALVLIPFIGAWIAWQQVKIARTKLQHDLYDKRFAVYVAAKDSIVLISRRAHPSSDQVVEFAIRTAEAVFLFDVNILEYLKELNQRATRLSAAAFKDRHEDDCKWFNIQYLTVAEKFKPYLVLAVTQKPVRQRLVRWRPWA